MKLHLVGANLFHVDGRTDGKKLLVAFCNFANASTKRRTRISSNVKINHIFDKLKRQHTDMVVTYAKCVDLFRK